MDSKNQISPLNKSNNNINVNEKQLEMLNNFEKFQNIYQSHDNIKKNSFSVINILKKQNDIFDKDYKNFLKLKEKKENNEKFSYLKKIYKKMNYKIPDLSLNHNIFNNNILLIRKSPELRNNIQYGCISFKTIKKGINFMDKLNDDIDNLKVNNINNLKFSNDFNETTNNEKTNEKKIIKKIHPLKEIKLYKKEIKKSIKTFSSLSNLDDFFNSSIHKKKLNEESRNNNKSFEIKKEGTTTSLKNSTRVNSPFNYFQIDKNREKEKNFFKEKHKIILNKNKYEKFLNKKLPSLEKLYTNVKKSSDKLKYNINIKNYFKKKNITVKDDISTKFLCRCLNSSSKVLFKKDFLSQDLEIRKRKNNSQKLRLTNKQLQLMSKEKNIKDIMKESEYKLIKIYCSSLKL